MDINAYIVTTILVFIGYFLQDVNHKNKYVVATCEFIGYILMGFGVILGEKHGQMAVPCIMIFAMLFARLKFLEKACLKFFDAVNEMQVDQLKIKSRIDVEGDDIEKYFFNTNSNRNNTDDL
ncbi:hypothetical protein C7J88_09630 [Staphylococcus muscae]|uniref:Phage protein n=1 Tax=Staphylococcus muscae TaxID=1294 RepID=A0ABQ1HVB5_9STAP|nr:hypothetical protein [Staphylococcus muscae]AVQ34409.1 hypothetical protein C7J88_09630 [Staphylococcus muscae]PNZ03558.1 hypothetical protein CD131_06090 [Staphylococcus muscae]GGA93320.1 hypothetical protein GCM10007183_16890 [Staphylococcus muscae]